MSVFACKCCGSEPDNDTIHDAYWISAPHTWRECIGPYYLCSDACIASMSRGPAQGGFRMVPRHRVSQHLPIKTVL